jgi:autotransporter-associated beta strand protein
MILNTDLTLAIEGGGDAASHWYLNGVISGPGGLKTSPPGIGGGILHLGGTNANTYAGATTINYGWAYLNKPASVIAVPGDLFINRTGGPRNRSGRVYISNDDQIAATSTVTLNGGTLYVEGGNQNLANVEFTGLNNPGLDLDGGSVVISPGRTLTVTTALRRFGVADPTFTASTSVISGGTLNLAGGVRIVQVDNLTPQGFTPTSLTISSIISNGDIEKTGVGVLRFSGADNTFAGNVLVSDGLFSIAQNFQMIFGLQNSGASNRITGTADATLNGIFNIDPTAVSDITGVWNLVDVANLNETFNSGLKLQLSNGSQFTKFGDIYRMGRWSFSTATGDLTLAETPEPATLGMGAMAALLVGAIGRRAGAERRTASA